MKKNLTALLLTAAMALAALCLTPLAHAAGTVGIVYYLQSYGGVGSPPFPFDPYGSSMPLVQVSPGVYLIEDGSGSQKKAATSSASVRVQAANTGLPPLPDSGSGSTNSDPIPNGSGYLMSYTNGLWIEATNLGAGNLGLNLHNTTNGDNYQLLVTTNLYNNPWDLGQIIFGASSGETPFPSTVSITNGTALFFKAHHAYPIIGIEATQSALEPTNAVSGQIGIFQIFDEVTATSNLTVYYNISGTASNGINYVTISNAITIPVNQYNAEIQIVPNDVGITPDKSIVLTLVQNTNYLIDPSYYYASNVLYANPDLYPTAFGDNQQVCPNSSDSFYVSVAAPEGAQLSYTIVTNATYGTVSINSDGYVTYTPPTSFEGLDSFAYTATSDGYSSAPAIVSIIVSDPVTANAVQVQTCRNRPVAVSLSGGDGCNESLTYTIVTNPKYGQVTGLSGSSCIYTSNSTNFAGTDSFMYQVTASTGDSAINVVTVSVGDTSIIANNQSVLTGTNLPVPITLSDYDSSGECTESNLWVYSITRGPTNGTLTGIGGNLTYKPKPKFEGVDSFIFTANDGAWSSPPAIVTIYVVGAPYLSSLCNLFGDTTALEWTEDSTTTAILQDYISGNAAFVIGRSTSPTGPFSLIATNPATAPWAYWDLNVSPGQIYYYVVALDFTDSSSGSTYQSAFSNTNRQTAQSPDLIAPDSLWYITDWDEQSPTNININVPVLTFYTNPPNMVVPVFTNWVIGPFSNPTNYAAQWGAANPGLPPLPPAPILPAWSWTNAHTIWAHGILNLTGYTPKQLSTVVYSTAIDNGYLLYINRTNVNQNLYPPDVYWNGTAYWGAQSQGLELFSPLPYIKAGTNTVDVVFWGDADFEDYFSFVVTTNTCQ